MTSHVAVVATLVLLAMSSPAAAAWDGALHNGTTPRDALPPDLPLDRDGVPARPLEDAELHRLLLALSATSEAAAALLAACHASGRGYGMPGWRACVQGR